MLKMDVAIKQIDLHLKTAEDVIKEKKAYYPLHRKLIKTLLYLVELGFN